MDDLKHSVAVALAMGDTFIPNKLIIKAIDAMDALIINDDALFINDVNIISIGIINYIADWAIYSVGLYNNMTHDNEIIIYINELIKNNSIEHKKELCIMINKLIVIINDNAGSSFPEIIIE